MPEQEKVKKFEFGKENDNLEEKADKKYWEAPDYIVDMAKDLIKNHHSHLKDARIMWLFYEDSLKYRGKEVPGRVRKVHDRMKVKLKKDFIIEISEPKWTQIEETGKEEAALDWLLCFATIGSSPGSWTTKDPDFSGFYNNVDRFGLWDRSLKELNKRIRQEQLPFQPDAEPETERPIYQEG